VGHNEKLAAAPASRLVHTEKTSTGSPSHKTRSARDGFF
jgi:hypothetical protein